MKASIRYFCGAILVASGLFAADPPVEGGFAPVVPEVERYRHIWEKSPFVTETPTVQESAGLAQRFVLTGVASLQNQPVIFVLDRQSLARLVVTQEPNQQGVALVSVQGNADPKQSQATIRLGTEQGVIRYDLAALLSVNQSADNNAGPNPAVAAAGQINAAGQQLQPGGNAAMQPQTGGTPAPRGVRVIRRPKPINLTN